MRTSGVWTDCFSFNFGCGGGLGCWDGVVARAKNCYKQVKLINLLFC